MSNHDNTQRPQKLIYNPTQPTQPRPVLRLDTSQIRHDLNRLNLGNTEPSQIIYSNQQTQPAQRRQNSNQPLPSTLLPGLVPRSPTPFTPPNPLQMTPAPTTIPGTYPSTTMETPQTRPLPLPQSIYQPLVPGPARPLTPPPGFAEYDRQQRIRTWQQEQISSQHWAAIGPYGGGYRQGMQVRSDATDSEDLQRISSGGPPSLFSGSAPGSAPDLVPLAESRREHKAVQERMSREARGTRLRGERTRKITVRKDDTEGGNVQSRGRREQRQKEQQKKEEEDEDEWEVIKRPDGVIVDDCVDSDDSDTWC